MLAWSDIDHPTTGGSSPRDKHYPPACDVVGPMKGFPLPGRASSKLGTSLIQPRYHTNPRSAAWKSAYSNRVEIQFSASSSNTTAEHERVGQQSLKCDWRWIGRCRSTPRIPQDRKRPVVMSPGLPYPARRVGNPLIHRFGTLAYRMTEIHIF